MFRLSQYMKEVIAPQPAARERSACGPVVIWNLVRRCNLACAHCYSVSANIDFPGELTTREALSVLEDLRRFRVSALILSGGEPLLRPDLREIACRAKELGFHQVALSTNGTLIDERAAAWIAPLFDYVGVSLDGRPEAHDRFRRSEGAFAASLRGLRLCRDAGAKVGVRFTLTESSAADLPWLLALSKRERIGKFYLSHLNYAGRGNVNRKHDALLATTRRAMDILFEAAWGDALCGVEREIVTGNNDADAVYFLQWVRRRAPAREHDIRAKLEAWGGNASGVMVANIDNLGEVHPDTYWWDHSLGNVRRRAFSEIWQDLSDPILAGLRTKPRAIKGRCGACAYFAICGGNTRTRARQLTGDPWQEDPGCYLDDSEIGVDAVHERVKMTPYRRRRDHRVSTVADAPR
jgi:heme d1 biosynthesis radical SAM protein NirJ